MIEKDHRPLGGFRFGSQPLAVIYKGAVKIWEGVSSCFGSGVWCGDKPWVGTDRWK